MNKIAELLRNQEYKSALQAADEILEKEPDNARVMEYKAIALKKTGRLWDALHMYDEVLKLEPKNGDTWFNRAICIRAMNDREMHDEASRSYQMAVESDPCCSDAFQNQGNVSSRIADCIGEAEEAQKWFAKSENAYRNALKANETAELHCNIADLYVKQKRMKEAIEQTQIAEKLDDQYQPVFYIRGYAQMSRGDLEEAIGSFDRAISTDPESGWSMRAKINKGICQFDSGDAGAALETFEDAAGMNPPDFEEFINMSKANAWYNIAFVKKNQGDMDACREALRKSQEYDFKFQIEHWMYEPKKEITGPAAKNDEHIID